MEYAPHPDVGPAVGDLKARVVLKEFSEKLRPGALRARPWPYLVPRARAVGRQPGRTAVVERDMDGPIN